MSGDYKYEMYMRAEEIAEEQFGTDFYSLTDEQQHKVFSEASEDWTERQCSRADYLNDVASERGL